MYIAGDGRKHLHSYSMRRISFSVVGALVALGSRRTVLAGANTSLPQARVADVVLARSKERGRRAGSDEASASLVAEQEVSAECEADAKHRCITMYDMIERPLCLPSWFAFMRQLQRFEMQWRLEPGVAGTYVLDLNDHTCTRKANVVQLRGSGGHCKPIADMFECCVHLVQGTHTEKIVLFDDGGGGRQLLRLSTKQFLPENNRAAAPQHSSRTLTQFNCRGTLVSLSLVDTTTRLVTSLFTDMAMQTFLYAFLTSLPIFLKRHDIGIRNAEFVSADQMRHFRFAWCFLRKEAFMTPLEMGELDNLIPP